MVDHAPLSYPSSIVGTDTTTAAARLCPTSREVGDADQIHMQLTPATGRRHLTCSGATQLPGSSTTIWSNEGLTATFTDVRPSLLGDHLGWRRGWAGERGGGVLGNPDATRVTRAGDEGTSPLFSA